jgi:ribosome-associated translation inhibitor RaiA
MSASFDYRRMRRRHRKLKKKDCMSNITMRFPVQITWRDMAVSPAVGAKIREEAAKLEEFYDRITSCRVMIEIPHRYQNGAYQFHVRIDLTAPGVEIVVNHEPTLHSSIQRMGAEALSKVGELSAPHKDVYIAIREAFKTARRKLQEYAQRRHGEVKHHETRAEEKLYND